MRRKTVSGIMLTLLLIGMLILAFNIQPVSASVIIYIKADGSVQGTDKIQRDGNLYTFTDNLINQLIIVERDDIVIDGATYTLQGTGSRTGISLHGRSNVTIKNTNIKEFRCGIWLELSSNNVISGNNITNNGWYGIRLLASSNNVLRDNSIANNKYNFWVVAVSLSDFVNDIDASNTVDGKPMYYWISRRDVAVPLDAGYLALVNCTRITAQNLNLANNGQGVLLFFTTNSTITGNNITNNEYSIWLWEASNYNSISGNNITNNEYGIWLEDSNNNTLLKNNIANNQECGILLGSSENNIIEANNITSNYWGVFLLWAPSNTFFHNNFINNTQQVYSSGMTNTWDAGYPSGGNYWSDYEGVDVKSGPNQDQPGSDRIGDTAYVIDSFNRDRYPLMYPWGAPPPPSYTLTIHSSPTEVTFTVDGISRTTPWSGTYNEGSSVSLVMPETRDGYEWSHWQEDGNPNRIKTVTMDTDITLTGVFTYVPPPAVGGKATPINIPMNKPETPALWIWLSTIILSLVLTVVYVKKRKRQ